MKSRIRIALYSFCIVLVLGTILYSLLDNMNFCDEVVTQKRSIEYKMWQTTEDDLLLSHEAVQMKIIATEDYIGHIDRSTTGGENGRIRQN